MNTIYIGTEIGKSKNKPADVIANEKKSCNFGVRFHCSAQGILQNKMLIFSKCQKETLKL